MKIVAKFLTFCLLILFFPISLSANVDDAKGVPSIPLGSQPPLIAIWLDNEGLSGNLPETPYLRIAIWENGRVVCAKDYDKWSHLLFEGKISEERVRTLKQHFLASNILDLHTLKYRLPDASVEGLSVCINGRKNVIYGDEPNPQLLKLYYDQLTPEQVKFMTTWKDVDHLAWESRPQKTKRIEGTFKEVPRDWHPVDREIPSASRG